VYGGIGQIVPHQQRTYPAGGQENREKMSGFVRLAKDGFSKFLKFIRFYQVRPQMLVNGRAQRAAFFHPSESQAFEIAALPGNCKCERFFFMLLI